MYLKIRLTLSKIAFVKSTLLLAAFLCTALHELYVLIRLLLFLNLSFEAVLGMP